MRCNAPDGACIGWTARTQTAFLGQVEERLAPVDVKEAHVGTGGAYGFVQLGTRDDALRGCFELDGVELFGQGRPVRVRPAHLNSTINVKDVPSEVGNRALAEAFKVFGEVVRAVVFVDEKSHPMGEAALCS